MSYNVNENEFGLTGAETSDVRWENLGHVPEGHEKSYDDGETGIGDEHEWESKDSRPNADVRRGYS